MAATAKDLGIIAAVISVVVLLAYAANGIFPFGEHSIARGDMVQQTIPNGMYYMWDVLHGKASPFFTWNSALGMDISGDVSGIFNPYENEKNTTNAVDGCLPDCIFYRMHQRRNGL